MEPARVFGIASRREDFRVEFRYPVDAVSFSGDGKYIFSVCRGVLQRHLWRAPDLRDEACSRLTRNLSLNEWTQYLGEEKRKRTCKALP